MTFTFSSHLTRNFLLEMILPVIVGLVVINAAKISADLEDGTAILSNGGSDCTTPNGKPGTCINIKRCHVLMHSFNSPKHPTKEDVDMLRKSRCGLDGIPVREFKVCCPSQMSLLNSPESSSGTTPVTPVMPVTTAATISAPRQDPPDPLPDVTTHRNLRLLDQNICGPVTEEKIIGGDKTGVFDYPWMALIAYKVYNNYIEFRCGGTVINNRYILTAAHCVTQLPRDLTPINVRPICLPIGDTATYHHTKFIVTGWGDTETGTRSPDLLQAKLTAVSNEQCTKAYEKNTKIWYKQLCAQGHQFSCLGDSGGPLQAPAIYNRTSIKFVQYGIVSFGTRNCKTPGYPSVYTRVAYYTDWILDHLKE
ncbi:CLIP domain-containing serine protease B4-like isoform X2 [Diachasmimorpha longicaudata]|uniref:CLIP domain-containing serine protease B4-like isoform X2 n=1 Tax=Diachasmimorpha longicaudata TaxID=58733 RepID=UPI0030B8AAF9